MNQYSILMYLLSKTEKETIDINYKIIGATEEELCEQLHFTGKYAKIKLYKLMEQFDKSINVFNLQIKQNPFNLRWYLTQSSEIEDFFKSNPFSGKTRLAATLFVVLSLCLTNSGKTDITSIQKLRKKKDIKDDLQELDTLNFITLEKNSNQISIHPNLGYYMDLENFMTFLEKKANIVNSEKLDK